MDDMPQAPRYIGSMTDEDVAWRRRMKARHNGCLFLMIWTVFVSVLIVLIAVGIVRF